MFNERPIEDDNLQAGVNEIKEIMARRGLAGAAMLVGPQEAAFTYGMHAPWSAITADATAPMGFRIRAKTAEYGKAETVRRVEAAVHTICQLCDWGYATAAWMEDLQALLRRAGIDFEHTPYGGRPLARIGGR